MDESEWLAQQFEGHRSHLKGVAYRMLGSSAEAEDAVQEAWLRLSRADTSEVRNLGGWLTTVVGRGAPRPAPLPHARREDPLDGQVPDPVVTPEGEASPEHEAELADSVGLALLVVLDTLPPAGLRAARHVRRALRGIAPVVGRSPEAARQLASQARRRVQAAPTSGAPIGPAGAGWSARSSPPPRR